jgi:hypothetical protein
MNCRHKWRQSPSSTTILSSLIHFIVSVQPSCVRAGAGARAIKQDHVFMMMKPRRMPAASIHWTILVFCVCVLYDTTTCGMCARAQARVPAWTDRILFKSRPVHEYTSKL